MLCSCTFESVARSKVPSLCITGCWILTSIPCSRRLDLHRTPTTYCYNSINRKIWVVQRAQVWPVCPDWHWPGAICFWIRDKGWCGDEWTVQVLANVDLLGWGSTVDVFLSGHNFDGFSFTLDSWKKRKKKPHSPFTEGEFYCASIQPGHICPEKNNQIFTAESTRDKAENLIWLTLSFHPHFKAFS